MLLNASCIVINTDFSLDDTGALVKGATSELLSELGLAPNARVDWENERRT